MPAFAPPKAARTTVRDERHRPACALTEPALGADITCVPTWAGSCWTPSPVASSAGPWPRSKGPARARCHEHGPDPATPSCRDPPFGPVMAFTSVAFGPRRKETGIRPSMGQSAMTTTMPCARVSSPRIGIAAQSTTCLDWFPNSGSAPFSLIGAGRRSSAQACAGRQLGMPYKRCAIVAPMRSIQRPDPMFPSVSGQLENSQDFQAPAGAGE